MDEIKIFEKILGSELKFGKPYASPFRKERNPSLSFYRSKSGRIRWKDFGTDEPSGGLYDFVGKHLETDDLDKIKAYIYDGKEDCTKKRIKYFPPVRENSLEIKTKSWDKKELEYWKSFGISRKTLKKFNVFPLKHFYVNDILKEKEKDELLFAEIVGEHVKIYSPFSKTRKWKSNTTKSDVFGEEQLQYKSDVLIVTKSLKDVMSLYELGFEAISPMSETSDIPDRVKREVLSKYKKIYILYDNDETGLKRGEFMSLKYSANNLIIPQKTGCKDISDLCNKFKTKIHKIIQILTKTLP